MSAGDVDIVRQDTEAAWQRLRKHVEWLDGGWIGFLTVGSPASAETLRMRLTWQLRRRTLPLEYLVVGTPDELAGLLPRIEAAAPGAGCVWVEALKADGIGEDLWIGAWQRLFRALNHRRDTVRGKLDRGGLLLVGPNGFTQAAQRWAPDLWSIRSVVIQVFDTRPATSSLSTPIEPTLETGSSVANRAPIPEELRGPEAQKLIETASAARQASAEERYGTARQLSQEAVQIARELGDPELIVIVLGQYATALIADDDPAGALAAIEESRELADPSMAVWPEVLEVAYQMAAANEDWDRAAEIAGQALSVTARNDEGDGASKRSRSQWLDRAGTCATYSGHWDQAEEMFNEALALDRQLVADDDDDASARLGLARGLHRVAEVALARGALIDADRYAQEELAVAQMLDRSGAGDAPNAVVAALLILGEVRRQQGDLTGAEQLYLEALAIMREHSAASEGPENRRIVSRALTGLGDVQEARGEWEAADASFREALAIDEALAQMSDDLQSMQALAMSLSSVGEVAGKRERWADAQTAYDRALDIRRALAEISDTPDAQRNLAVSLAQAGDSAMAYGDLAAAESRYSEALKIHRAISEAQSTPQAQHDLGATLSRISLIAGRQGDLERARAAAQETYEINRRLAETVGTPDFRHDVAAGLWRTGELAQQMDDRKLARNSYHEALEILRELAENTATPQSRRDVAVALTYLGNLALEEERWEEAEALLQEALDIHRDVEASLGTSEASHNISTILTALGDVADARGESSVAAQAYEEALAIDRELAMSVQTPDARRDVAVTLVRVGDVAFDAGDFDKARRAFQEALAIDRELISQGDTPEARLDLAADLSRLAGMAFNERDFDSAEGLTDEAVDYLLPQVDDGGDEDLARPLIDLLEMQGRIAEERGSIETARAAYDGALTRVRALTSDETDVEARISQRRDALP